MYKLILTDLDGTLLDSRKTISAHTLGVLERCRRSGILIGIATARSELTASAFINTVKPDVIVSNSGGMVRCCGEVIFSCTFSPQEAAALIGAGLAEGRGITVDAPEASYSNLKLDMASWHDVILTDYSDFNSAAFKVCIEGTDRDFADRTSALVENCIAVPFSDCDWFKYSKADAAKEKAIAHIEQFLGISPDEIIAFGDDFIDIEMLRCCGTGVAMANAIDQVKQVADAVAPDNDSDGVAYYIEHHVL